MIDLSDIAHCCCSSSSAGPCPDFSVTLYASYSCTGCPCADGSTLTLSPVGGSVYTWVDNSGGPCGCDGPVFGVTCTNGVWSAYTCSGYTTIGPGNVVSTSPLEVVFGPFVQQDCDPGTCTVTVTE